jgi:hypothetical protein
MIGYHSVSVIADAYLKGINDFDAELALNAMIKSANWNHYGLDAYKTKGFLSVEDEHESVSKTLEYAYDDWCIAQMAQKMGKVQIANDFIYRSQAYKYLFDPKVKFIRPRKNGTWLKPFDPYEVNNHYTEANAWQYTFFIPQNPNDLIQMYGGPKGLESKLDSLFLASEKTSGRNQADITGLIGQYAHGNEPSHHIAYLYNYAESPFKAQRLLRKIMKDFYAPRPAGLIGNEDCGQMSAWYVFSAMGFYPVCPGDGKYAIGSPLFEEVQIQLENEKKFTLVAKNNTEKNVFVKNNGQAFYITQKQIDDGESLILEMTDRPENNLFKPEQFGLQKNGEAKIILSPVFQYSSELFRDTLLVSLEENNSVFNTHERGKIYYSLNGTEPSYKSLLYEKPFLINQSCTIKAALIDGDEISKTTEASFYKFPNNYKVHLMSKYNSQYTGGGDNALIDGIRGDFNWRKGNWQGYQYQDFEVIIDLQKVKKISKVSVGFLQDTRAWYSLQKSWRVYKYTPRFGLYSSDQ